MVEKLRSRMTSRKISYNHLKLNNRPLLLSWLTYGRVFSAAREWHTTALSTCIGICAIEVNIEVPVISSKSPAALPLEHRKESFLSFTINKSQH